MNDAMIQKEIARDLELYGQAVSYVNSAGTRLRLDPARVTIITRGSRPLQGCAGCEHKVRFHDINVCPTCSRIAEDHYRPAKRGDEK